MATIVDIRSAVSGRSARTPNAPTRGSAEILLFTGVRYSRWGESPTATSRVKARQPRDRLDLDD